MLLATVIAVTAWALPVQATGNAETQAVIVHMHDGENQLHLDVRTRSGRRPIGLEAKVPSSTLPTGVAIEEFRAIADTAITLVVRIETTAPRSFDLPVELWTDAGRVGTFRVLADWEECTVPPGRFTTVSPNPFNPITQIRFAIEGTRGLHTSVHLYNSNGQRVRRLLDDTRDPGHHVVIWDGRDDQGRQVGSGIYFCQMVAGGFVDFRKLTLLR